MQFYDYFEFKVNVIVNSINPEYYGKVSDMISTRFPKANYIETKSNGKPGKGKNSGIDLFKKEGHDYDYIFLIDGDDFFIPHCI